MPEHPVFERGETRLFAFRFGRIASAAVPVAALGYVARKVLAA